MTRRAYIADGVGDRIRRLRQERGWTQTNLAEKVGCTKRAIIYYERDGRYPPAPILAAMASVFRLSVEALLAPDEPVHRASHDEPDLLNNPDDRRLWKKFRELRHLNQRDQSMVFRLIATVSEGKSS